MTKKIHLIFPIIFISCLLTLLYRELFYANNVVIPSALIGETIPPFNLRELNSTHLFTEKNLRGKFLLLNVWATWCYACKIEHDMLLKIKNVYHIPIYSINYKDDPQSAKIWLEHNGNPYIMTGLDNSGEIAIDLGVYGTPETFVIDPAGKIIYRHVGIINQTIWDQQLYPLFKHN